MAKKLKPKQIIGLGICNICGAIEALLDKSDSLFQSQKCTNNKGCLGHIEKIVDELPF